jgi:hypothetical protein
MTDISIFDLPPLHKKPSASTLLHAINSLAIDLPSFEGPSASSNNRVGRDATQYLTSIVSSPLAWLPDGETQDAVWTAASRSLSERAGRSGEHWTFHLMGYFLLVQLCSIFWAATWLYLMYSALHSHARVLNFGV